MERKVFTVNNISCGHCTSAIEEEVGALDGVTMVEADVDSKRVMVEYNPPADWPKIKALLVEIEYPASE
ncbi:MAG: heavy-metal-associated domain-containing protein [Chloroflexota bacterium]